MECISDIVEYICLPTTKEFCTGKKKNSEFKTFPYNNLTSKQSVTTRPLSYIYYSLWGRYLNIGVLILRFGNACI